MKEKNPDYTTEPSPEYERGNQLLREAAERVAKLKRLSRENPEIIEQLRGTAEYILAESSKEADAKTLEETIETRKKQKSVSQEMLDILSQLKS